MAEDIKENAMSGGTPARLRGLAANGNSISPTLEEVMNAMGIYTYSFTLAAKEEKDLGDLGYGMYLLASPNNAATAIFAFGSYSKGFVSDAGSNFYCDYTDGTKGVAFGRKTTNGSFFIKNNRSIHSFKKDWYLMIVVLQAMWIFILVMPVPAISVRTGRILLVNAVHSWGRLHKT